MEVSWNVHCVCIGKSLIMQTAHYRYLANKNTGLICTQTVRTHWLRTSTKKLPKATKLSSQAALDGAMIFASIVPMHHAAIKRLKTKTATC